MLRYGGITPAGEPLKDGDGNIVYSLDGRAPEVRQDFFGTGFIVGDGKILTNHHVAQPWWKNDEMDEALKQGLQPEIAEMAAYFPEETAGVPTQVTQISSDADLALLHGDLSGLKRPTLRLDGRKEAAVSGQSLISLGYATGISAILARAGDETVDQILKLSGGEWFRQEHDGAGGKAVRRKFWILLGSHHHHRNLHQPLFGFHVANQLRPGNVRHDDIEYRCREALVFLQNLVGFTPVASGNDGIAFLLQNRRNQPEYGRVIISDDDAARVFFFKFPGIVHILCRLDLHCTATLAGARGKFRRQVDRRHHTGMFCQTFARDVERRSVIHRGANKWQPQRHVNRFAE